MFSVCNFLFHVKRILSQDCAIDIEDVLIAVEDLYLLYSYTQSGGSEGRKVFCKSGWDLCL
jgi:hypothetical protein